jgi:hypothetical protein
VLTRDAAESWRRLTRHPSLGFSSLHFFSRHHGLAAALDTSGEGVIYGTRDGGQTWRPRYQSGTRTSFDLGALGPEFAWAVPRNGWPLLFSTDGGATWEPREAKWSIGAQAGAAPPRLLDLEFADPRRGVLVGPLRHLYSTTDGAQSWRELPTWGASEWPELVDLAEFRWTDAPTLLGLDASGTVHELFGLPGAEDTSPLPQEVRPLTSLPGATFIDVDDDRRLWLGGPVGLHEIDPAERFAFGPSELRPRQVLPDPVSAQFFLDDSRGWVAEPGGGLKRIDFARGTIDDLTPYRYYPAPWYWLACLGALLLLVPALAQPSPREIRRSVAERAVSDRPIEAGEPDPLGFQVVALGMSRFLRNTATRPPLTLAITGAWGTGKSSLMNLLRADLAGYGFRPVWFNAWHHQKEEHLLAALLENIRAQAIPSWLRPEGWAFRGRLLGKRLRRWWLLSLLLVIAFGFLTGWMVGLDDAGPGRLLAEVELVLQEWARWLLPGGAPSDVPEPGPRAAGETEDGLVFALLATGLGMGVTLFRGLRAFGVKPGELVVGLSERARVRDAQAQTGFRYRFAVEFRDVAEALQPRTLTILIDDLDRCRPGNVLEVLEAVNFLVTSGDCFVVLGIDRERVERCVGYSFRDVAEEILDRDVEVADGQRDDEPSDEPAHHGRARRAAFARQYLEKLINIEVPVPRSSEKGGLMLLKGTTESGEPARWRRLSGWLRSLGGRWWVIPALLPLALALGLWTGAQRENGNADLENTMTLVAPQLEGARAVAGTEEGDGTVPLQEEPEEAAETGDLLAQFLPSEPVDRPHLLAWALILVALAGAGVWVLTSLPEVEVHDSDDFTASLEDWYPLLYLDQPTPRSIKRFLNRVRWYAMRQRPVRPPRYRLATLFETLRTWLGRIWPAAGSEDPDREPAEDQAPGGSDQIPERILVALASVEHTHPDWLELDELWDNPQQFFVERDLIGVREDVLPDTWDEPLSRYRESFERISRGVKTR